MDEQRWTLATTLIHKSSVWMTTVEWVVQWMGGQRWTLVKVSAHCDALLVSQESLFLPIMKKTLKKM